MLTIVNVIEKLIQNYFKPGEVAEFKNILAKNSEDKEPAGSPVNQPARNQLEPEMASTPNYHANVNFLITFAEARLGKQKFLEFLQYLGELSIWQGEFSTAAEIYNYILNLIRNDEKQENVRAYSLFALGEINSRYAEWDKSIGYIKKAKELFLKLKDYKGCFRCENLLGTISGDQGNFKKAKKYFERGFSYLRQKKDSVLIGMLENNLGVLNNIQGDYDTAFTYHQRALVKFEQTRNYRRITEVRHNLGMLFTVKHEYQSALNEFDLAISASLEGFFPTLSLSYLGKAYIFIQLNDYLLAGAFADKAMEVSFKLNDRLSIADIYKVKGIIERNLKNYTGAENYLLSSMRINEELENELNQAETSFELGLLYSELGKTEMALNNLNFALAYYKKQRAADMVSRITTLLKDIPK